VLDESDEITLIQHGDLLEMNPEDIMSVIGTGSPYQYLSEEQVESVIAQGLDSLNLAGKRIIVIIPDGTRTMPMPMFFRLITRHLLGKVQKLDFLIALGTHPPMSEAALLRHVGITPQEKADRFANVNLFNHAWKDPAALTVLGSIPHTEIHGLSGGLLEMDVPVRLNCRILDYDEILICGPVFPHEVVGFSGGNKYFFPGIAGSDIIDFTHWLGALITSYAAIGVKDTPMRRVIDRAAAMIPVSRHALCSVVTHEGVKGVYFGAPEDSWSAAADLSAQVHIRWVDRPYRQVLSVLPNMYDEIWVGAKGMYKMEPVIADGGEVIIYAPHIRELSTVHGKVLREIGYHVRDYFVKQWDRFKDYPWGVLAHSTHLRGIGTYENGIEHPRIQVTLATGIPEEECRQINLSYCDPATLHPEEWAGRESEGVLLVPRAGEYLYRLKK
jgi:nickel-dependent lactate racemase